MFIFSLNGFFVIVIPLEIMSLSGISNPSPKFSIREALGLSRHLLKNCLLLFWLLGSYTRE